MKQHEANASDAGPAQQPPLDLATKRRLAIDYQVDERTLDKEWTKPGSVRGLAGCRARAALAAIGLRAA